MTARELILMTVAYAIALTAVIYFTRATMRRVIGSLAGGAVVGLMGLGMIVLFERLGWWHIPFAPARWFVPLFYLGLSVSCAPIYLVTWRIARRFGWRGLAVSVGVVAVIGPPRDYFYAATFPRWMVFGPGVAPILADSFAYIAIVVVGHGVMRVISGPARADRLTRG